MATQATMYELTFIVNAVLSEDQIKEAIARVKRNIEETGGEILNTYEWGSRRLSYPIRKKRNGYYVNLYFRAGGDFISRIERLMQIDDDILRYLTLKYDAKMMRHYERFKGDIPRQRTAEVKASGSREEEEDDD